MDDSNKENMPPPKRRFIPGTQEYEEALRSGRIHSSICVGLKKQQNRPCLSVVGKARQNQSTRLVVSPEPPTLRQTLMLPNISNATSTALQPIVIATKACKQESSNNDMEIEEEPASPSKSTPLEDESVSELPPSDYPQADVSEADSSDSMSLEGSGEKEHKPVVDKNAPPSNSSEPASTPPAALEHTRFSDIIGHAQAKLRIDEILLPLGLPASVTETTLSGIRSQPTSILMYGPPGCGKTQLARAVAGEAHAAFFNVAPSDVLSKFVGESEAAIRNIFRKAKEAAGQLESKCAVVFFDEIDALGHTRENGGSGEGEGCSRRVLAELLLQFNGMLTKSPPSSQKPSQKTEGEKERGVANEDSPPHRVLVVAATNRPEDCDPALLRRFGVRLFVGPPSHGERKKMMTVHLNGIHHCLSERDLNCVAVSTEGWSGSDIESLAREAAMAPVRECLRATAIQRRRSQRPQANSSPNTDCCGPAPADTPRNDDSNDNHCHGDNSRQVLLQSLENLRPVRIDDFENALFLLSRGSVAQNTFGMKHAQSHYDSSSDEEDFN